MTSKDRAKELIFKYYTEGTLTDDEIGEINRYAHNYTYKVLYQEMREDPKYSDFMAELDVTKSILRDKFTGSRDN